MNIQLRLDPNYRAIFISDIHGNIDAFTSLLKEVNYQPNLDYLFILGDIIEKGPKSLESLKYVMELSKNDKCFCLVGNVDYYLLMEEYDIKRYMRFRTDSILCQMAREVGFDYSIDFDVEEFKTVIKKHFTKEIQFIRNLPSIIESDDFILAHAGIFPSDNFRETDAVYAATHDLHGLVNYRYPKPLIVGHWLTAAYHQTFCLNPHLNDQNNVFSIDGANSIKPFGQLNALIWEKQENKSNLSSQSTDQLKVAKVIKAQMKTQGVKLLWPYNKIEIIKEDDLYVEGYQQRYGMRGHLEDDFIERYIRVPKAFVYMVEDCHYTHEFGNYFLEVPAGVFVKIVLDNNDDFVIIKYLGEVGMIKRQYLDL